MEQLIKEETAKLAKALGFDHFCNHLHGEYDDYVGLHNVENRNSMNTEKQASAPTQTALQRWLREEKKVMVTVGIDPDLYLGKLNYHAISQEIGTDREGRAFVYPFKKVQNYEEALEDGLLRTMKKIKETLK